MKERKRGKNARIMLILTGEHYEKGERLTFNRDSDTEFIVVKVYKRTRWRKFLTRLGLDVGLVSTGVKYKVEIIN
jgi:hypothetical protein